MKKQYYTIISIFLSVVAALIILVNPSNETAPEFQAQTLQGQNINQQNFQGKVTLLNFWYPSCPGCVSEMPKLIQMAHDYQNSDFQIIGIAVPVDPIERVNTYVETRQLPFQIVFDQDEHITQKFVKTPLYPTSVLINQRGEILKTFVGEPDFTKLYQEVGNELAKYDTQ